MKRRYLALLLAASTAVTQIFSTASIALAEEVIAEPEAVYTDAEEFGEIMPEDLIFDAETPDEGQANQSFADLNVEDPENQPLEDFVEEGQANQLLEDAVEEDSANQPPGAPADEGQVNPTEEESTEYGQADEDNATELSLDPMISILSIEPETVPVGLADEENIDYITDRLILADGTEENADFQDRLFNCETVTLTVEATDEVKDDPNWIVNWIVGIYDENKDCYTTELPLEENGAYSVSEDTKQITLDGKKIQEQLNLQDDEWFNINAEVVVNIGTDEAGKPILSYVDGVGRGICLCEASQELRDLPWENQDVIKGWEAWLPEKGSAWIRNPQFPDGQICSVQITGVTVSNADGEEDTSVVSCEAMTTDDGYEGYQFEAVNYGQANVTVSYQIETGTTESGEPAYSGEYTYDYRVNVCEDYFNLNLTSNRDNNGYTNLRPEESVTLYASMDEDYESNDTLRPDHTEVVWRAEPEGKVSLKPSEDGLSCEVTAAAEADTQVKVTAALKVTSAEGDSDERAQASWDINICDEYFVIELEEGGQGSGYSYGLEHGESITVTPTLSASSEELNIPEQIEWRWEEWDEEKLTIKDKNEKQLSTEEEDGNTGTAPFTLTKQGSEWTNLCLRAYADGYEGALADLWLTFEEQNYDIWYENLKEDGWTWFYTDDQNPMIELNVTNLLDKDQYRLEWTLGTFDEDGNLVSEMDNMGDTTYYRLLPVTLPDGTVIKDAAVQLDLNAVQGWLEGWGDDEEDESEAEQLDHFSVQASVYTKTEEENEEEALYLGGTHCADVWLNATTDEYNFGLGLEEDRVLRAAAGSESWINAVFSRYIQNAEYPDGKEVYLPISDVQLKVAEAYPQKSILLDYDKENEGWNLEFLNPCEAELAITYTGMDGKDTTETIQIEVLGESYYLNLSSESLLLFAGETQTVSADVIYWQQNQEDRKNPEDVTIKWEIAKEWPANEDVDSVLTIRADASTGETGTVTGNGCLINAVADGEAKIVLQAYDQNDEVLTTADLWVYVNAYKLVDENEAATQQYTDIGQTVELALKLQELDSETGAGKDYEGKVRYVWGYSAANLQLDCSYKQIELSSEDDLIYMIAEQKASSALKPDESNAVQIILKRIASEWGYAEVKAEIWDEENKEWQEVASQEWRFEEYEKDIWPENTRGDYYTWIYTDEADYTLSMSTSDGLLENGRYLKWTIGIAKDGTTIAVYPEKSETDNDANENSNYTTDGSSLTIKSGGDLNTWITGQKATWQAANQGQDPDEALEVFIEAAVMRDIPAEEGSQAASEQSNAVSPIEICSCRIGFDTREPYEEWEDSYYSTFLLGGTSLYYEYDTEHECYWVNKYVENQEHPWGATETYQLICIAAQNLDENFEPDGSSSSDPVIQVNTTAGSLIEAVPLRAGNARLIYTYNDGTSEEDKTFSFDITVVGSTYAAHVSLPGDADHMQLGETKQIRLVVKQLESVWNEQSQIWEIRRSDLTEDQYTVSYHDRTDGRLAVREDGKVTVLDNREDWASIGITVTILQGDAEPYKLQTSFGFSVADEWYTFDTAQSYAKAPGETITISPRLCYYENGTLVGYADVDQLNLTPEWYDDTVSARLADGTITVNSSEEGSGSFCLTANYTDQYGYHREISTSIWVGFCDHTHNEADGWQTAYWSTCSETGRKEKWCSKCGWIMETAEIPMLAHSWDNGVITSAPTCQKEGVRTFTCNVCAATTDEPISKTAHQAGSWTLQSGATCTTGGKEVQKCKTCGTIVGSRTTAAKAHTAGSWQTEKAATCTADGTEIQKCTVCGTTLNRRTAGKTGHLWSSYTTTKQPTGVEEGWEVRTCQKCHHSEGRAIAKLPATIKLTEKKLTLQLKKSATIKSIVTGLADGDAIASWTSSNTKIVTVNQNGKITGKKVGKAAITVTMKSGISALIPVTVQKKAVAASKITVERTSVTLTKGSKLKLNPVVTPITTQDKVTYKTSNKKVVTVDSKGQITAKGSGTATITIKAGKKSRKVKVTVPKLQPTKITGIPTAKTLKKGKALTLKPKLSPDGSEAAIKYSSSNKKVAAVSSKGKITAKKKGTAVITVTAGKVKASCTITVR